MSLLARSSSEKDIKSLALSTAIVIGCLLVLPSCCIPQLHCAQKGPPLPDSFNGTTTWDNSAQIGWCEFFDDPVLTGLISQALTGNQELKILAQEVRIANNEVMARQGEYLPFVGLGAGAGIDKASRFTRAGAVEDQLTVAPGKGFPEPLPDFLMAANVTWEIDIWKKLRNAKNAAALRYLGTIDGRNYVVTRLVAEVADNYYELLALDNRLQTLDKTIEIQEQSLRITQAMKETARGTELAVQRFQAEVRKNQSERLIIQQEIIEVENRINFLVGRFPQPVERLAVNYVDLNLHALSVGVPSQLLQNRADIRQAERQVAAAGLDVKVARARFYPSLALRAGVGYQAFNTKYLFQSPESLIYNAAGDLVAPLINKKAIKADYLTANAMQLQAIYNYQRTVINAFTEVINRMAKVDNYGKSIAIKKQQLKSLEASVDQANVLFLGARADYIEVLLAQRELMEARMVMIQTKQQQLSAIVYAYQALGGGGVPTTGRDTQFVVNSPQSAEEIGLEQPLQLRPDAEQEPDPQKPAAPQPEPLPPGAALPLQDPRDPNGGNVGGVQVLPPVEPLAHAGSTRFFPMT
ncbi:MAG: TolC family protein [Planctomycetales bacterium]|nr:TolC family protein [Planctomycetales bacterium]